ncbi:MAG: hypothetical protein ACLGH6_08505 [Gammaproteobacteria bacterium]
MKAAALLLAALALPAHADWSWSEPLTVNTALGAKIFPHLESANRQGIAVSGEAVGVVWEDNRSGSPQCYLALKPAKKQAFQREAQLSRGECYEPVLLALGRGRFLAAWEEDGKVRAQVWPGGKPVQLSKTDAAQVTLAQGAKALYAAWAEQDGRFKRIVVAELGIKGQALRVKSAQPVEAVTPIDEQGWPALAVAGDGSVTVAWEDRRHRHTVPMASHSRDGRTFAPPARLSDIQSGSAPGGLGAGTGAMRPTLARWGEQGLVAVWLDKRDFLSGYDVYAAFDPGTRAFGRNLKVQDSFGDNMAQWHALVVSDGKHLVALWDDARDGTSDVWLSEWEGEAFGEDFAVPGAHGPGEQSDPVATLDTDGALHVVWLDRDEKTGTRVRYARAVKKN